MNFNPCTVSETFFTVCGHVATVIGHNNACRHSGHHPYRLSNTQNGQEIELVGHSLRSVRWIGSHIIESKCIYCQAVELKMAFFPPPNTWISDIGIGVHRAISPDELASRREFWKNYVADQVILSQRQHTLSEAHLVAIRELEAYLSRMGEAEDVETLIQMSNNVRRLNRMQSWYDMDQNFYLGMVRSMGVIRKTLLFDPTKLTSLTYELLYLVNPEDVPSGETCGICTENLVSTEQSDNIRRVFCGKHIYHEKCIVRWFEMSSGEEVSCPLCRRTHRFYRAPLEDWDPQNDNQEDDDNYSDGSDGDNSNIHQIFWDTLLDDLVFELVSDSDDSDNDGDNDDPAFL